MKIVEEDHDLISSRDHMVKSHHIWGKWFEIMVIIDIFIKFLGQKRLIQGSLMKPLHHKKIRRLTKM